MPWRLHDIRRTGTTNLQALGFPIEVGERVINHHQGGEASGIRAVYNLYEYLPEKTRALNAWGEFLGHLVKGGGSSSTVAPIAAARPGTGGEARVATENAVSGPAGRVL